MTEVHVNSDRPDLDGPLSLAFNRIIRNRKSDDAEINDMLEEIKRLGLDLVNAKPGQSIVIFIYCNTVENAVKFTQLFNSGFLKFVLKSIFNRLILTIEPYQTAELDLGISLEYEDISTVEKFTGIECNILKYFNWFVINLFKLTNRVARWSTKNTGYWQELLRYCK